MRYSPSLYAEVTDDSLPRSEGDHLPREASMLKYECRHNAAPPVYLHGLYMDFCTVEKTRWRILCQVDCVYSDLYKRAS
jgi:hypothetical protein